MIVTLLDILGDFIRRIEIPDAVASKISALTLDGVPYTRLGVDEFQMANGFYAAVSRAPESIAMGRIYSPPIVHEVRTTKWFSGIIGVALFDLDVTVTVPWADSMTIRIRDTRPLRLNSLWCPEWEGEVQHGTPAAVRAAFVQSAKCRDLTNRFCNTERPKGTKIVASIAGMDTMSRLVCDIHKIIPPLGKDKEIRLSLQEHLLGSGLFQPAGWRTK